MIRSDSIVNLMGALRKAQLNFPAVKKDTTNPHFRSKYATLDGVIETLQPTLDAHGLVIAQPPDCDPLNGWVGVTTILFHDSGEYIASTLLLPSTGPSKEERQPDPQQATAAVTYARRTAYLAILGVAPEDDDDGNKAAGRNTTQSKPVAKPATKPAAQEQKVAQVPKAEIPKDLAQAYSASTPVASAAKNSGTIQSAPTAGAQTTGPITEQELQGFRGQFTKMCAELTKVGLAPSKGLPQNRKVLAYLLNCTSVEKVEDISRAQWNAFFQIVESTKNSEAGVAELIRLVNLAAGIKE
jgi:hypothetical protein